MNKKIYRLAVNFCLYAAQGMAILLIAFLALRLHSYDFHVPFNYSGDSVVILMYIKGMIQDGWPSTISQLSAPFAYPGAAFPILTSVDWSIIKMMSAFTTEPGYLLNGFWLLTLVLSAWSASYAAYQLGLSRLTAFSIGILYAFLPYAWLRNVAHLNLVYYIVPLLCLLMVVAAGNGSGVRSAKQATLVGLAGCVLQGFNYIYFSFFTVLLLGVVILITYTRGGGVRAIRLPLIAIFVVILSTSLNMIPTMQSWSKNGPAPEMGYKNIAESEIYGAKIRKMLSPHSDNILWSLSSIGKKDVNANWPNENENTTARLGIFGSIGLLLVVYYTIRRRTLAQPMEACSVLGLSILLIITVGGFGAVINLLTVPDIRAYNRFSVFLSFYVMVFAGLWMQSKAAEHRGARRLAWYLAMSALMIFSLYDQLLDKKWLISAQQNDTRRANEERSVVGRLEHKLLRGAAVLQLPFTGFPPLAVINKMESYDHVRPFLWSNFLKWSWPSFTQRHRAWQIRMSRLHGSDLIEAAILSGFDAIWIDKFGYPDDGNDLIASLAQGQVKPIDLANPRFVALDLRGASAELNKKMTIIDFERKKREILGNELLIEWGNGFYQEEKTPEGKYFRWVKDNAKMTLRNSAESVSSMCVAFSVASPHEGHVRWEGGNERRIDVRTSTYPKDVSFPMTLEPGETRTLKFTTDVKKLDAPGDPRELYFYLMNFAIDFRDNCNLALK